MAEILPGTFMPSMPVIGLIVGIIVIVVAWKVFKFTVKKVSAVVQGLAALALLGCVLSAYFNIAEFNLAIAFGLAGIGILFGAISNIFG